VRCFLASIPVSGSGFGRRFGCPGREGRDQLFGLHLVQRHGLALRWQRDERIPPPLGAAFPGPGDEPLKFGFELELFGQIEAVLESAGQYPYS